MFKEMKIDSFANELTNFPNYFENPVGFCWMNVFFEQTLKNDMFLIERTTSLDKLLKTGSSLLKKTNEIDGKGTKIYRTNEIIFLDDWKKRMK